MYIEKIVKSEHYKRCHEKDVPFWEILEIIFSVKNPKKKGNLYVYKTKRYYITATKEEGLLTIKSAKRK